MCLLRLIFKQLLAKYYIRIVHDLSTNSLVIASLDQLHMFGFSDILSLLGCSAGTELFF